MYGLKKIKDDFLKITLNWTEELFDSGKVFFFLKKQTNYLVNCFMATI